MHRENQLSVIIISYHSEHLLNKIINNLYTFLCIKEIIVVENGNTNYSFNFTEKIKILFTPKNLGYGGAINFALTQITGNLILIINPDIEIISFNSTLFEKLPDKFILGGNRRDIGYVRRNPYMLYDVIKFTLFKLRSVEIINKLLLYDKKIISDRPIIQSDWINGDFILTTLLTLEELNGFDENFFLFYEENDLCLRAKTKKIPIYISPLVSYSTNLEKSSQIDVNEIKIVAEINSSFYFHKKNEPSWKVVIYWMTIYFLLYFELKSFTLLSSICASSKIRKKLNEVIIRFKSVTQIKTFQGI